MTWACPACDRTFARRRGHVCAPGMPLPVWLDERAPGQRRAAEAVLRIAQRDRELVIEAVGVGVLIKRERTIVELRPKARWLDMSFISAETLDDDRIARTVRWGTNVAYFVHLTDARDVDATVRGWLRRALAAATPARATARRGTTR